MKAYAALIGFTVLGVALGANLGRWGPAAANGQEAEGGTAAVVRARMFELVDEKGEVRAQMRVESDGTAMFRMRDGRGTIRVKLGASEEGSGLVLLNDRTEPAIPPGGAAGGGERDADGSGEREAGDSAVRLAAGAQGCG